MKNRIGGAVATLALGLVFNLMLGAAKLVVGVISQSASVTSDALNNISDAAVSVVAIIATALSARRADHDHPYGHGRYEYIAAFVVGAAVLSVGVEAFVGGFRRVMNPMAGAFDATLFITLGAAIAIKAFMAVLYYIRGKKLAADTLGAACIDSISDVAVTSVVLACLLVERYTGIHIDGYAAMAVAAVIIVLAVKILRATVNRLLGARPDPVLYAKLRGILESNAAVLSVHDIVINDYGTDKKLAEADAVFPSDMPFTDVHAVCDALERKVYAETGIRLCLHADPLLVGVAHELDASVAEILVAYGASAHDISIDDEKKCVELDVMLPIAGAPETEIEGQVRAAIRARLPEYAVTVNVDYI